MQRGVFRIEGQHRGRKGADLALLPCDADQQTDHALAHGAQVVQGRGAEIHLSRKQAPHGSVRASAVALGHQSAVEVEIAARHRLVENLAKGCGVEARGFGLRPVGPSVAPRGGLLRGAAGGRAARGWLACLWRFLACLLRAPEHKAWPQVCRLVRPQQRGAAPLEIDLDRGDRSAASRSGSPGQARAWSPRACEVRIAVAARGAGHTRCIPVRHYVSAALSALACGNGVRGPASEAARARPAAPSRAGRSSTAWRGHNSHRCRAWRTGVRREP